MIAEGKRDRKQDKPDYIEPHEISEKLDSITVRTQEGRPVS